MSLKLKFLSGAAALSSALCGCTLTAGGVSAHGHNEHDHNGLTRAVSSPAAPSKDDLLSQVDFEPEVRAVAEKFRFSPDRSLELRVTRGMYSKGYGSMRVSVVAEPGMNMTFSIGGGDEKKLYGFDYAKAFQYRWQSAYDLGRAQISCGSGSGVENEK